MHYIYQFFQLLYIKLLEGKNIPAWVNCWPRTANLYLEIKQKLDLSRKIEKRKHKWSLNMALWSLINSIYEFDTSICIPLMK